ncbi:hypothetical protein L914_06732 [Phytophthora nicotianae]|uniref:Uncharacterized protein n=1 Tax=Phytophthora nicotianae TaxID=4792 RepID=W2NJN7_PHYNI|nr:hypothetical protein L914_06732 [Phytophthora nicotianae]
MSSNFWCHAAMTTWRSVSIMHELEKIVEDMIKSKERIAKRDGTSRQSRSRDSRDIRREKSHRRDRRDSYRRRDDYRNQPRVTLAEASLDLLLAEPEGREATQGSVERSDDEGDSYGDDTDDYKNTNRTARAAILQWPTMTDISLPPTRASNVLQLKARTPAQTIVRYEGTYQIENEASIKIVEEESEASTKTTDVGATTTIATSTATTDVRSMNHAPRVAG